MTHIYYKIPISNQYNLRGQVAPQISAKLRGFYTILNYGQVLPPNNALSK